MKSLKQYLLISCINLWLLPLAKADGPRCYLYGKIRAMNTASESGVRSIKDFIRMNFDASSDSKCERMLFSYCKNNVLDRGQIPVSLKAYYRTNNKEGNTYEYDIDQSCGISRTGGL